MSGKSATPRTRGKFITFEGIDGAGKTTHILGCRTLLESRLQGSGRAVVSTREPGGTPLGEALRDLVLHQSMHLDTEALLMFAARREHMDRVIGPALARGDWVLCDRFTDATFAYQGGGRGLPRERLDALERWVQGDFQPDLTLLFDVPPDTAATRRQAHQSDRFERESHEFFERTRDEYLRRAAAASDRIRVIDAGRGIDAVRRDVDAALLALLAV
ncbi:dTMP kinase [Chitinasiproducens palmae]|uniref:Thymidylate kinase n=1 Tax=Chitinasiproducens palmae TaxID=1770053 RepID=A0A1H2PVU8_9BURK|nr:dTMP kinase [Chitinasiproducens palmae]SDV51453.1 thymidylate kinase [Chitinasiproducens palmae]